MTSNEFAAVEVSQKTQGRALPQEAKAEGRRPYRKPQVYALGALEQVQANLVGTYYDGPSTSSWRRY